MAVQAENISHCCPAQFRRGNQLTIAKDGVCEQIAASMLNEESGLADPGHLHPLSRRSGQVARRHCHGLVMSFGKGGPLGSVRLAQAHPPPQHLQQAGGVCGLRSLNFCVPFTEALCLQQMDEPSAPRWLRHHA